MKTLKALGTTKEELQRCIELSIKKSGSTFVESFGKPDVIVSRQGVALSFKERDDAPNGGVKIRSAQIEIGKPNKLVNTKIVLTVLMKFPVKLKDSKDTGEIVISAKESSDNKYQSLEQAIEGMADDIHNYTKRIRNACKTQLQAYMTTTKDATEWFRGKI